jgi:hypothetical protein
MTIDGAGSVAETDMAVRRPDGIAGLKQDLAFYEVN